MADDDNADTGGASGDPSSNSPTADPSPGPVSPSANSGPQRVSAVPPYSPDHNLIEYIEKGGDQSGIETREEGPVEET